MIQGSQAWHEFRGKGLGSSDIAVVLGISKYKTPHELWLEKTGLKENPFEGNYYTERGQQLESIAREHYELCTGIAMVPKCFTHPEHSFLRASLDGWNEEKRIVLEIKNPKKSNHYELAKQGVVPEEYFAQMQHQLLVSGADLAHYWCFNGEDGALVEVKADKDFQAKIIQKATEFWEKVLTKTPPPLSEKEFLEVEDQAFAEMVKKWWQMKSDKDQIEQKMNLLKEEIQKSLPHPNVTAGGMKVSTVIRKGSVDYKKVPELSGVDLEKYRSDDISFITISEIA